MSFPSSTVLLLWEKINSLQKEKKGIKFQRIDLDGIRTRNLMIRTTEYIRYMLFTSQGGRRTSCALPLGHQTAKIKLFIYINDQLYLNSRFWPKFYWKISFQQSYLMTVGKRVIYVKTALIDSKRFNV